MSSIRSQKNEKSRFGIVIYNFFQEGKHRLRLPIGESVQILEEYGNWYFGFSTRNKSLRGIFPKNYVHLVDVVDKSGSSEVMIVKQQYTIVQEITSVLREWGAIWKHLYITHSEHFRTIERKMRELMECRSKIISGTLPIDELKQMKRLVTSKIDIGNKLLGLDMVVRDEHGNILNPEKTSTIQMYWQHQLASERITLAIGNPSSTDSTSESPHVQMSSQCCYTMYVNVRSFICRANEDVQLLAALYDAKDGRPFTENCLLLNNAPPDQVNNIKVLFTDLGSSDVTREKVYLVCYVVKVERGGAPADPLRRPFGVAAVDISSYLSTRPSHDPDARILVPFFQCEKESNLEGTLRRILTMKELPQKEHKIQGLYASFRLLPGDIKQVQEENLHLLVGQTYVARKMGFPEVILPGDVRNDLYLTLISGEFGKSSKLTDKSIQVTVTVCTEKGQVIAGVMDTGWEDGSEYRSVIYYHEDKPRWAETCKVTVPIEDFKLCHLKFTFRHRSVSETKDKNEKPFAISYVRLMQENGTTLRDEIHELLVYKIDAKKFDASNTSYLSLPSTKMELNDSSHLSIDKLTKPSSGCFSLSSKDCFVIQTNICSTKLTQNIDLLGLLNWTSHPKDLENSLQAFMKVSGEEIVKFLQDVLDALFNILMQNTDSDAYDNNVFHCLLYIIGLVSDRKYEHFQPVLDLYIKESFSATLAHKKLITVLKSHIDNANSPDPGFGDISLKIMKSSQYCIRFIVTSRQLYSKLNEDKDGQEFDSSFNELLQSIAKLMSYSNDVTLRAQAGCLKHLPSTIPDIITVFNPIQLSHMLTEMINNMPPQRLTKQKMMSLKDMVHSPLFLLPSCRRILLPVVLFHTKSLLEATDEVELCVKILSDVMDLLFNPDVGPTLADISDIMMTTLRTVIQSTIAMDRESPLVGNLMAVMLSILRQMTAHHFEAYIKQFPTKTDLLDFLMEILLVFKDLVTRPVYAKDWCEMIMLQNSILLKSLRFFSHTIRDFFSQRFEYQAWSNFFHCAIAFLTQPTLQLEGFSATKRARVIARYKDMRRETGFEIRSMWFNLGQHKIQFVPSLVGQFLEMTLIPETELRRATIPIFFDMMQCEFYLSRDSPHHSSPRDSALMRANFSQFENEMIAKLDNLLEMGLGDEHYKDLFCEIMTTHCENHSTMREQGLKFVKTVTRLMEHLLEYRSIINDENKENKMSCTVNLLDFYSEINRKEMYIRYVYKLCDLHLECDNFTEAAFTLKLHTKLLGWTDAAVGPMLRSVRYPTLTSHRQLKLALYQDILQYFDNGKMWECAVEVCQELCRLYEETDYAQLAALLRKMAQFYDNILLRLRPEPEYFRVAYYGRGFPAFLQNKVFIYRGKEYERLSDFSSRTLNQLPNAELMNTLTPPGPDITDSLQQYVQINKVEPIMDEKKLRQTVGKPVNEQILKYHRVNNVQKFKFSRPYHKRDGLGGAGENEFATLWLERSVLVTSYPLPGILRWFPVTSAYTYHLSPLANAIETMQQSNKSLRDLILQHKNDPTLPLNPLSMKLNGILDAAVNGGINNYEKAFFTAEYLATHEEDAQQVALLKELIAGQIPLLDVGLRIHRELAPPALQPFHHRLELCFSHMQAHVVHNYGAKSCDIKYEPVSMRRQSSLTESSARLSTTSFSSTEGRTRVSSLTKSQVASLTTFVMSNISPLSTLSRTSSVQLRSTPLRSLSMVGAATLRKEKKKKRAREEPSPAPVALDTSRSQWYTGECEDSPLRTQQKSSRPSSAELEPRTPSTGTRRRLILNGASTPNRNSLGTESTTSEEDAVPPPLPAKQRESDYCNLPDGTSDPVPRTPPLAIRVRPKPVPPEPVECDPNQRPPTPPPKNVSLKL